MPHLQRGKAKACDVRSRNRPLRFAAVNSAMEAAPKRVRRGGGGSAPDRLSALSDDLLRCVLSFLPSRFAVQTSVLSKRWIGLWRSVPAVQLDINDFGGFGEDNWRNMKDFANEFLMLQNTERLDVFRLVVGDNWCPGAEFHRWVRCGINHQPLVLQIHANELGEPPDLSS